MLFGICVSICMNIFSCNAYAGGHVQHQERRVAFIVNQFEKLK